MERWVDPIPALKRQLADEVLQRADGWSQTWASWVVRMPASRISELRRGNLDNVSLERLVRSLSRVGYKIEIMLTPPPKGSRVG